MTGRSAPGYHPFRSLHLSLPLSIPRVFLRFFLSSSSFFFFFLFLLLSRVSREFERILNYSDDRRIEILILFLGEEFLNLIRRARIIVN